MEVMTLATQDISSDDMEPEIETVSHQYWGRLVSLKKEYPSFFLEKNDNLLGRGEECDLVVDDKIISNKHCRILRVVHDGDPDPVFLLEDLSTYGTYVDGAKVGKAKKKVLTHGCEISLGLAKSKIDERHFIFQTTNKKAPKAEDLVDDFSKYEISTILGRGNFAVVKLAIDKETGKKYAAKIIDKKKILMQPALAESFRREVEILKKIKHPGVISFIDYHEDETEIIIIMDLVTGGELAQQIFTTKRLPENKIKYIFFQISKAVEYLHDSNITHRDLKPENILIQSPGSERVMIADFGLSKNVGQSSLMQTVCGTPIYLAPEILQQMDSVSGYGKAVDLWSLGVILYVMCAGHPPFHADTRDKLFSEILNGQIDFSLKEFQSFSDQNVIDLIKKLLTHDPAKRLTIKETLRHPWLQDSEIFDKWRRVDSLMMPPPSLKTGLTSAFHEKASLDASSPPDAKKNYNFGPTNSNSNDSLKSGSSGSANNSDSAINGSVKMADVDADRSVGKRERSSSVSSNSSTDNSNPSSPSIGVQANNSRHSSTDSSGDKDGSSRWGFLTMEVDETSCCSLQSQMSLDLVKDEYIIGRDPSSDIRIDNKKMSKKHCKIWRDKESFFVLDLSANGTYLGENPLSKNQPTPIGENDKLMFKILDKKVLLSFHTETRKRRRGNSPDPQEPASPSKKITLERNKSQNQNISHSNSANNLNTLNSSSSYNLNSSSSNHLHSSSGNLANKKCWGKICPLDTSPRIDLVNDSYFIGSGNQCQGSLKVKDSSVESLQCRIYRENGAIFLENLTKVPTFVNEQKVVTVAKLNDLDEIWIAKKKGYVFKLLA